MADNGNAGDESDDAGQMRDVPPPVGNWSARRDAMRLVTLRQLAARPAPSFLVEGLIPDGGGAVLYGKPESGKSFIALSMALSIAIGRDWLGLTTRPGKVVYVAAEASDELQTRARAALGDEYEDLERALETTLFVVERPIAFMRGEVGELLAAIAKLNLKPALVVIDTLSKCFVDGDESANRDMNVILDACDQIRQVTGAAVLLIHHPGRDGIDERGSSLLRAAADAMLRVVRDAKGIQLSCNKMRRGRRPPELLLNLEEVSVPDAENPNRTSCRVVRLDGQRTERNSVTPLRPAEIEICIALRDRFEGKGATAAELVTSTKFGESTVLNGLRAASDAGYVRKINASKPFKYVATAKCADLTCAKSATLSEHLYDAERPISTPPPVLKNGAARGDPIAKEPKAPSGNPESGKETPNSRSTSTHPNANSPDVDP